MNEAITIHAKCSCLSKGAKDVLVEAIDDLRKKREEAGLPLDTVTELMDVVINYTDTCSEYEETPSETHIDSKIDALKKYVGSDTPKLVDKANESNDT